MRRNSALRLIAFLSCALALVLARQASAEISQQQWNAYSAEEFAEVAGEVFKSSAMAEADKDAISKLAWSRFLADESFVQRGDLKTVQSLVKQFASRRSAAVDATESAEQVETQLATLRRQLIERLRGNEGDLKSANLYSLNETTKMLGIPSSGSLEKAELFVDWMSVSDWRALPLTDRYNLYGFINADAVDRRSFSARWTGTLTAPTDGSYILRQLPQYAGTDSRVKVYIGEQLVLDSTDTSLGEPRVDGEARFESQKVELSAGKAVSIRVEMVHSVTRIDWSEGAPMVVLTWEAGRAPPQIIPSTAFGPPKGFGKEGGRGLKGEYFSDLEMKELKVTRLDAALDLVSSWPPLAPIYQKQADAIFRTCVDDMLNDAVLAKAAGEGNKDFFNYSVWRVAYRMTATERVKLIEALIRTPEAIALMTPEAMGRLMQAVYMLPGKEHLVLLGEWASLRPQPRCEPGEFPGWGKGYYQELNTDFYWLMGLFMQGPYRGDAQVLWDEHLVRENGECNLAVAYVIAYATRAEAFRANRRLPLKHLADLQSRLDDKSVVGDARVTWLIARAYAEEIMSPGHPNLLIGKQFLDEASLVAESADYQSWALQELAARYASLGHVEPLKQLIDGRAGKSPAEQAGVEVWNAKAKNLAARYVKREEQEAIESKKALATELEQRLAMAQERKDDAETGRLQELLKTTTAESIAK